MFNVPVLGRLLLASLIAVTFWELGFGQAADPAGKPALVMVAAIEGPIGPATSHHVERVVKTAAERGAHALVLRLNTPGGLVTSTREIVSAIVTSPVPVIGYVSPPGGHAASAGTYILYATHLAAMAPGTNLGAATPVQIGGVPGRPGPGRDAPGPGKDAGDAKKGSDARHGKPGPKPLAGADAMTAKVTNDAVAFIRSLARMRGRNAEWAERAVREAASLPATEALEKNVIEIVAADLDKLVAAANGRKVTVGADERVLATAGARIEKIEPGTLTKILAVISNPSLAFILMMLGVYGIIYEFINPGGLAPGIIGAISLTIALYSLNMLPLDYAGLALIVLGIAFMVAEALTPAFGILGFGGLAAFVLGSAMLIDTDVPEYQISWWLIAGMAAVSGSILVLLLGATVRAYAGGPRRGHQRLAGRDGEVISWSGNQGHVWVRSERWLATGPEGIEAGRRVRVTGMDGLTLRVTPVDPAIEKPPRTGARK